MSAPRILVTGASGFAGRRLIDALKERFRVIGIARRSQVRSGAPVHPAISWHQVDIGEREPLATVFRQIASDGPVEAVIHLAAHYDFSGEEHPEYWRTNVQGLRHVLELCRTQLTPRLFVFASSVAACDFPAPGRALDENEPAGWRSRLRPHQGSWRANARRVPRCFSVGDGPICSTIFRLVRVSAAVHVPEHVALARLEQPYSGRQGALGENLPARTRRGVDAAARRRKAGRAA